MELPVQLIFDSHLPTVRYWYRYSLGDHLRMPSQSISIWRPGDEGQQSTIFLLTTNLDQLVVCLQVSMLKMLMDHNLDQRCVIKFLDSFKTPFGEAMVFEALDISLYDYICEVHQPPVQLDLIRTDVQQVWTQQLLPDRKRNTDLLKLWGNSLTCVSCCVFAGSHSTGCTEEHRGNPQRSETGQHNAGGSS